MSSNESDPPVPSPASDAATAAGGAEDNSCETQQSNSPSDPSPQVSSLSPPNFAGLSNDEFQKLQELITKLYRSHLGVATSAEKIATISAPIGQVCQQITEKCEKLQTEFNKLSNDNNNGLLDSCIATLSTGDNGRISMLPGVLSELYEKAKTLNTDINGRIGSLPSFSQMGQIASIFHKAISLNQIPPEKGEVSSGGRAGSVEGTLGGSLNQLAAGLGLPHVYKNSSQQDDSASPNATDKGTASATQSGVYAELRTLNTMLTNAKVDGWASDLSSLTVSTKDLPSKVDDQTRAIGNSNGRSIVSRLDDIANAINSHKLQTEPLSAAFQRLRDAVGSIGLSLAGLQITIFIGCICAAVFMTCGHTGYRELRAAQVQQQAALTECHAKLDKLEMRPQFSSPVPELRERIDKLEETLSTRFSTGFSKVGMCRLPPPGKGAAASFLPYRDELIPPGR